MQLREPSLDSIKWSTGALHVITMLGVVSQCDICISVCFVVIMIVQQQTWFKA